MTMKWNGHPSFLSLFRAFSVLSPNTIFIFKPQAVDQIVQCLTDDKYKGNMVCIVAGYAEEIDQLMDTNPGLASRFPETLHFPNFGVEDCCRLLESKLKRDFSTELAPDVVGIGTAQEGSAVLRDIMSPLLQVCR